jgi:endonuclease/exonuclease/phosphatase family metal-dependent hydrolase
MRFLLYNIRYGAGIGRQFHLPIPYSGYLKNTNGHFKKIVDFIKSVDPDIVGLIEVDSGSFRSEKSNQAESVAREINHRHFFQSKYARSSFVQMVPVLNKQGNAFITNQDVLTNRCYYLNHGVKRLVLEMELNDFTVFLVHLSLKFRHRQKQLRDLHLLINQVSKPCILAGDFNVLWGHWELVSFLRSTGLVSANGNGQPSHPVRAPKRQLDFIFHSPEICITGFRMPLVKLSDHAPLICDFEIESPKSAATKMVSGPPAYLYPGDLAGLR